MISLPDGGLKELVSYENNLYLIDVYQYLLNKPLCVVGKS